MEGGRAAVLVAAGAPTVDNHNLRETNMRGPSDPSNSQQQHECQDPAEVDTIISGRRTITANQLRRLAEWADGVRGETLQLIVDEEGARVEKVTDIDAVPPGAILLSTVDRNPLRKVPKYVDVIKPSTGVAHRLDTSVYDAVCWSEAALEKFMLPYYVRFYSRKDFDTLRNAFCQGAVIAVAHIYPTFWEDLPDDERRMRALSVNAATEAVHVLPDGHGLMDFGFIPFREWLATR